MSCTQNVMLFVNNELGHPKTVLYSSTEMYVDNESFVTKKSDSQHITSSVYEYKTLFGCPAFITHQVNYIYTLHFRCMYIVFNTAFSYDFVFANLIMVLYFSLSDYLLKQ